MIKLTPHIKNYSWGSEDPNSWVAKIAQSIGVTNKPFAEAWYGDHSNGPSLINGENISKYSEEKLDFLGKILSISKPLSIQLHPNAQQAKQLNLEYPEEFRDLCAKEEGAIALTTLDIAYSLITKPELVKRLKDFPQLRSMIGDQECLGILNADPFDIKNILHLVLNQPQDKIKHYSKLLWANLKKQPPSLLYKYLTKLEQLYPGGDVGIFVLILMNIIRLEPGQGIYTPTGCPHAYLCGELIEIMKPSDNVIRCGLTNKKIDQLNFLKCLNSHQSAPEILNPENSSVILGNLVIDFLESGSTIFTGNKPKIVVSLDAKGELISKDHTESFTALSSFLITKNKTVDIKFDSGRIISFSSN